MASSFEGYTKHYYANGERLATSIGAGGWCSVSPDAISSSLTSHETELLQEWNNIYKDDYPCEYPHETTPDLTINEDILGSALDDLQYTCPMRRLLTLEMDNKQDILWEVMYGFCQAKDAEKDIFYRHSDHLGSANWITDLDGNAIQYLHYLPYGQMLLNQQAGGYDEQYKFTGKERDAESGYDYFGARYYASPLFHWTTVDPLVDNYLHITPYAYCNWNPVKFIDPDGRDDIEIQWYPEKEVLNINRKMNKDYDQIHIIGENGNRIVSSEKFFYGTIGKEKLGIYREQKNYTFRVVGDENAASIFEFLGSNFTKEKKMPLEWSRVQIGASESGKNIIGTSMKVASTSVGLYILDSGYTIRGVDHNHPSGNGLPSGNDLKAAQKYNSVFPNATLRIFTPGNYTLYNKYGVYDSSLLEFVVTPTLNNKSQ